MGVARQETKRKRDQEIKKDRERKIIGTTERQATVSNRNRRRKRVVPISPGVRRHGEGNERPTAHRCCCCGTKMAAPPLSVVATGDSEPGKSREMESDPYRDRLRQRSRETWRKRSKEEKEIMEEESEAAAAAAAAGAAGGSDG